MNSRELANRIAQQICSILSYTPSEAQWKSIVDGIEKELKADQKELEPNQTKPRRRMVACPECETMFGVELSQ